ncbi:MAG: HIT domain-containing protein [Candidatus Lokiarchaeota archaeon]|nr:HIT domain-containing protein [Candidatus Lokiarchaeota archaeon]
MRKLFAGWRIELIKKGKYKECFLCELPSQKEDKKNLILKRGKNSFIILNAYPYSNGHLLIAPYKHKDSLNDLEKEVTLEIFIFIKDSVNALKKTINPDGFNIGINLGSEVSGAGITGHLHWHIVPRWKGDHNFMPVISDTRVIPEGLQSTYEKLKPEI